MEEWIANDRDLYDLGYPCFPENGKPLWQFYDGLSNPQKAEAKSDQGLALGTTDVAAYARSSVYKNKKLASQYVTTDESGSPINKTGWELPVDPLVVAKAVMSIKANDRAVGALENPTTGPSGGPKTHNYPTWK